MALTTQAVVKEEIKESGSANDALIDRHVDSVSTAFRQAVGRPIEEEAVVEWLDGPGRPELILRHFPIIGDPTITEDGVAVATADLFVRSESGIVVRFPNDEPEDWSEGRLNIKAEYQAGWTAASIPEDIQDAVTKQVIFQLRRTAPYGGRLGERSTSIGDNTSVFMVDAWLPYVAEVLSRYRRVRGA